MMIYFSERGNKTLLLFFTSFFLFFLGLRLNILVMVSCRSVYCWDPADERLDT